MARKPKTTTFTLDMAAGRDVLNLPVKGPDGRTFRFRIPQPTDAQRVRLLERVQAVKGDAELKALLADLLVARTADDSSREDILAMLTHPESTDDAISQLLAVVLTGRVPDPKQHGQLLNKLADQMMDSLIQRL